jgi:four helix bundle protein
MAQIKQFEDLAIWKESTVIAVEVYALSDKGKLKADYGMKDQIRRAAMSISNNIAEGFEYDSNMQFIRFLRYAKGSSGELRNQLYVLYKAEVIEQEIYEDMHKRLVSLSKQISGFIKYLREYEQQQKRVQ